jgi:molybdopterin/thiamine biosynthesis adenylyltransferase
MNTQYMLRKLCLSGEKKNEPDAAQGRHGLILCRIGEHPCYPKAPVPMCFTRQALATLIDTVGVRPPESGAMGFSPKEKMGFDLVEFSSSGTANSGGAVYRPDSEWGLSRCEFHMNQPEDAMRLWSGDLHSHPFGCTCPSGKSGRALGDLGYVEEVFEMTEWMEWFFIPILTSTGSDDVTLHPWVCRRGRDGLGVDLMIADVRICDVSEFPNRAYNPDWERRCEHQKKERAEREAEAAQQRVAVGAEDAAPAVPADGVQPPPLPAACAGVTATKPQKVSIVCAAGSARTAMPNRLARTEIGAPKAAAPVPVGQYDSGVRLAASAAEVSPALAPGETGEAGGVAMEVLHGKASSERYIAAYLKRLDGIVSPAFRRKTILTVGVGAGSYAVEKLLRLCPQTIKICDYDIVEFPNLARTAYTVQDALAGRLKVDALALRAAAVNPWVRVRPYATSLTRMSPFQLDELFDGADLVVGGTDSLEAQALVNTESVRRGVPAVFIGIHAGAQGGRVIWTVPGKTPCYRCVARDRFEQAAAHSGSADLPAAVGSIFDCQFIDMLAAKIGVALLERGQDSAMGRFFEKMGVRNDVVVRCDPDYAWGKALWGAVLGDLPKQPKDFARELNEEVLFAMDSVWLKTSYDPRCPVCGGGQK